MPARMSVVMGERHLEGGAGRRSVAPPLNNWSRTAGQMLLQCLECSLRRFVTHLRRQHLDEFA